jgi:hypothetical protein
MEENSISPCSRWNMWHDSAPMVGIEIDVVEMIVVDVVGGTVEGNATMDGATTARTILVVATTVRRAVTRGAVTVDPGRRLRGMGTDVRGMLRALALGVGDSSLERMYSHVTVSFCVVFDRSPPRGGRNNYDDYRDGNRDRRGPSPPPYRGGDRGGGGRSPERDNRDAYRGDRDRGYRG